MAPHKSVSPIRLIVIDLRSPPLPPSQLAAVLSSCEQARANRFHFQDLQERFRLGRGMLRHLLADSCGVAPSKLEFDYSEKGKPSLRGFPGLHFNVSHSGDLWACATGGDSPLGIDIERAKPIPDFEAISRRFFSSSECEELARFPEEERHAAFFRCWTRKEAYIKALGEGLSRGLATFSVSCSADEYSPVTDSASPQQWHVRSFLPADGYAGALVTTSVASILRDRS